MQNNTKMPDPTEQAILEAIRNMDYGEITITIHDQKPVLMEVVKKIKL